MELPLHNKLSKHHTLELPTQEKSIKESIDATVYYHSLFEYPLTRIELDKWKCAVSGIFNKKYIRAVKDGDYYITKGNAHHILKRKMREKASAPKLIKAQKAAWAISLVPTVKMVGLTGSLAMRNADDDDDIDLLVVTRAGTLWTTRIMVYVLLFVFGHKVRKPGSDAEKDRLCLNIWLDEKYLSWPGADRNIYTAHEIAHLVPLVSKGGTYQRLLLQNKWLLGFWPNSVDIRETTLPPIGRPRLKFIEKIARNLQFIYMSDKITKEKVGKSRALFHPVDLGKGISDFFRA